MITWVKFPVIYEINTWAWLAEISSRVSKPVTLANIPDTEWDQLAAWGFDVVWFMGVWERSPAGVEISNRNEGLLADFQRALPDFHPEDNIGSPYCVRRYEVDARLGGPDGLATARRALANRGMRLMLDFVPNHVALDHPWVTTHPEYLISGDQSDRARDPQSYAVVNGLIFACGRDPNSSAWQDVLQVNAFSAGLRAEVIKTLRGIAAQCDAVRCDMAMLMLSQVFERTWGERAGPKPIEDYWNDIIPAVRTEYPSFKFIAEVYWDLEAALLQQGFDFCYDKRFYDCLVHEPVERVRRHLLGSLEYQERLVRFLENHDEPRAAATSPPAKARASAVAMLTLPGARLLHQGQLEGRRIRLPVFLGRLPVEPVNSDCMGFYRRLLAVLQVDLFRKGDWQMCDVSGWPDNATCQNLLSWCWRMGRTSAVIVINYASTSSQGLVRVPWDDLAGADWRLEDLLSRETYNRAGDTLRTPGLFIDLAPWKYHFLMILPAA
jgi:hypothetical protein